MPNMGNATPATYSHPDYRDSAAGWTEAASSLADAFFTTTQQRVLGLLFGQPSRSFYVSELIRLTGSGSGAVQREMKRLTSSGAVTAKLVGRQKHYQANPDNPVFKEVCAMVRKTVGMVEPVRAALASLAERISLALVYGSVAKGTDTAASDIDLLVVADDLTLETLFAALAPVESKLGRRVSPVLYTRLEFRSRRASGNPFLARVLAGDHQVILCREDGAA